MDQKEYWDKIRRKYMWIERCPVTFLGNPVQDTTLGSYLNIKEGDRKDIKQLSKEVMYTVNNDPLRDGKFGIKRRRNVKKDC